MWFSKQCHFNQDAVESLSGAIKGSRQFSETEVETMFDEEFLEAPPPGHVKAMLEAGFSKRCLLAERR